MKFLHDLRLRVLIEDFTHISSLLANYVCLPSVCWRMMEYRRKAVVGEMQPGRFACFARFGGERSTGAEWAGVNKKPFVWRFRAR